MGGTFAGQRFVCQRAVYEGFFVCCFGGVLGVCMLLQQVEHRVRRTEFINLQDAKDAHQKLKRG